MADVKHTPGKWFHVDTPAMRQIFHGCSVIASEDFDSAIIATVGEDVPGHLENARLIAAAPDLLSALKSLRNEAAGALGFAKQDLIDGLGETNVRCIENRIAEADAAIAKAGGAN